MCGGELRHLRHLRLCVTYDVLRSNKLCAWVGLRTQVQFARFDSDQSSGLTSTGLA
ncbi:hypothetical protein MCOR25_006641 [Pyricularia grisea]|nr:hypothetical protein MCOR25_006641 [Pyricularia grisea]